MENIIKNKNLKKTYSLWLMPKGDVYNKLNKLISQLSKKYSTPNFEPHVTLLSGIVGVEDEIKVKASELATLIKPYEIKLTTVDYFDEYFRCLFIKIQETKDVMDANLKTRDIFNKYLDCQHRTKYMPHLSLLYGNFSPQTKEEIIEEIGKDFDIGFEVQSIHLFLTESEIRHWRKIKEFNLK